MNFSSLLPAGRHQKRLTRALFRGILKREARREDVAIASPGLRSQEGVERQITAMIESEEFALQRLPTLMANAARNYRGEKVFFLHVPKTAGTSLRLALIEAMGVPSLDRYKRVGGWESFSPEFVKMWPLLVGHTNISNFPNGTHTGVTVFREPRARILSKFHQIYRTRWGDDSRNWHLTGLQGEFDKWLPDNHPLDFLTWFLESDDQSVTADSTQSEENWMVRQSQARAMEKLSSSEVKKGLKAGLAKIQFAEWIHNDVGMNSLISRVLSRPVEGKLPRVNTVLAKQSETIIQLTPSHHQLLNEISKESNLLFKLAEDAGLVKALSEDEADEQFEIAANRLGFKL